MAVTFDRPIDQSPEHSADRYDAEPAELPTLQAGDVTRSYAEEELRRRHERTERMIERAVREFS